MRQAVRSVHGLGDLSTRAEAFVGVPGNCERLDRCVMGIESCRLHEWFAVEVQADGEEIRELSLLMLRS